MGGRQRFARGADARWRDPQVPLRRHWARMASLRHPGYTMDSATQRTPPRVLAFDIFGTVVDWHGSIVRELRELYPQVDGDAFATAWRAGYQPAMRGVMAGERGWTLLDDLHRWILDELLVRFQLEHLDEVQRRHLNKVWHRLDPWPDALRGLTRLRTRYTLCTLSNGNLGLLADMAKRAGLPWDLILSAEVFRAYKPDPSVYLGAARVFDIAPAELMLVAAHHDDLAGARACGLQTAYIERPFEFGEAHPKDVSARPENTLHARDLEQLAQLMAA
jgi:2-haloacid dehalogenase